MSVAADVLSWVFLLVGSFFAISGGIGVIRMPDLFTRLHAAGVTDTGGAGLILVGLDVPGRAVAGHREAPPDSRLPLVLQPGIHLCPGPGGPGRG